MTELPPGLTKYSETPVFTDSTMPKALTASHKVKKGTWGKIVVRKGALNYILAGAPASPRRVGAGDHVIVEPDVEHFVEVIGPVTFIVEFYRDEKAD